MNEQVREAKKRYRDEALSLDEATYGALQASPSTFASIHEELAEAAHQVAAAYTRSSSLEAKEAAEDWMHKAKYHDDLAVDARQADEPVREVSWGRTDENGYTP